MKARAATGAALSWKLKLGTIERQTRFGVNYSANDYTIRLNGVSTDLVNIGTDEYRAKNEGGFLRIKTLGGGFEVTDKKGIKYLFGQRAESRIAQPADANRTLYCTLPLLLDRREL